jgi:translation initiation factor IF-3
VRVGSISNQNFRINDRIRIREVRLIDETGKNLGILPTQEARDYAESKGLDLVEVAPDARPPVCRVMDYGKFMYEQTKKERAAKKTQKQVEIKGIRIRPDTDSYHIGFKVRQARSFILKGNKVRVICQFRGRERSHPEIARATMTSIAQQLADIATVEQNATFEGRNMTLILTPDPVAIDKLQKAARAERAARAKQAEAAGAGAPAQGEQPLPIGADEELDLEDDFEELDGLEGDDEDFDDEDFDDDDDLEGEDDLPEDEDDLPEDEEGDAA